MIDNIEEYQQEAYPGLTVSRCVVVTRFIGSNFKARRRILGAPARAVQTSAGRLEPEINGAWPGLRRDKSDVVGVICRRNPPSASHERALAAQEFADI